MFDSIDDWLIIAVVAGVLLYGSTKIPQLAHNLGRSTGEFKRGKLEVEKEVRAQQAADAKAGALPPPGTAPSAAPVSSGGSH
ncbi:MAG: Sec-independent protein translocase subunit TatA/TatB [Thermoplasmata archaeon]